MYARKYVYVCIHVTEVDANWRIGPFKYIHTYIHTYIHLPHIDQCITQCPPGWDEYSDALSMVDNMLESHIVKYLRSFLVGELLLSNEVGSVSVRSNHPNAILHHPICELSEPGGGRGRGRVPSPYLLSPSLDYSPGFVPRWRDRMHSMYSQHIHTYTKQATTPLRNEPAEATNAMQRNGPRYTMTSCHVMSSPLLEMQSCRLVLPG